MKAAVCFYSGTGNSLWTARELSGASGATLLPLRRTDPASLAGAESLGLVFPVHMWGVPRAVLAFAEALPPSADRYCWAAATNAGQVSGTLLQLARALEARGSRLSAGFGVVLPSNYIPWGGPPPLARREELFRAAERKVAEIGRRIADRAVRPVERGPLWQRVLFTRIYRLAFPHVPEMDGKFRSDERCNGCGVCARACPAGNIRLERGAPVWLHRCEQCLACIQWCPQKAVQYGKRTASYERYHHPEVELKAIFEQAPPP